MTIVEPGPESGPELGPEPRPEPGPEPDGEVFVCFTPNCVDIGKEISRDRVIMPSNWPDTVLPLYANVVACALCVNYHYVRSNDGSVRAELHCRDRQCPARYTLESNGSRREWRLKVKVKAVSHSSLPRPLRRDRRKQVADRLKHQCASEVRAEMAAESIALSSANTQYLSSEIPALATLRQAHYETSLIGQKDKNIILDVLKRAELLEPQYVRSVTASLSTSPAVILLWMAPTVELMQHVWQSGHKVILGIDSTKCPLTTRVPSGSCYYYYSVVLRHPVCGETPISVMDMVNNGTI